MKPIYLPNVTLVVIDCVAHELTQRALDDTLKQIIPAKVLIFTNAISRFKIPIQCPMQSIQCFNESKEAAMWKLWYEVPKFVNTSHTLTIEYDGWVLDSSMWRPEFLKYDYIGAPWPWHQVRSVGNGGFSLRSKRLMEYLADRHTEYPILHPEDEAICRDYRTFLELAGFKWAPIEIAEQFSFENGSHKRTFGFHGLFNFPKIMTPEELSLCKSLASPYVKSTPAWSLLK